MATLIISEKNKAAQAIAEALGSVKKIQVNKMVSVYHVPSRDTYVLPLRGHIQQYENTAAFEKWATSDPREIITNPNAIEKIPSNYAGPYISALKTYARICDTCIIGTDADIEGCNIGLMDAFPFVHAENPQIHVLQIWLNNLQKAGVLQAYNNLIPPKWTWAYSGEARSLLDAVIGFSATREVSLTLRPILQKINAKFASIGRVQTCLLYLLYLREDLIRNFQSTPFWTLSAILIVSNGEITAQHLKNNFNDKAVAEAIYNKIKDSKQGIIQDYQQTPKNIPPPTPLNTSDALQLLTQKLGITADLALKTMEELYLNKILSYPRTDSDVYPKTYDHLPMLQQFLTHSLYGLYSKDLLLNKRTQPRQGKIDAGDHTPITPLQSLELNTTQFENDLQRKVYDLISRHYLATFGESAQEINSKAVISIDDELFIAQTSVLIKPGFLIIAPFLSKQYDIPIDFSQTNIFPVKEIQFQEKETQPPPRYTDTTLLKLMEQKNLGTKSTRPAIIQILIDRQYIERRSRSFFVKDLGYLLIDTLKDIWLPFLDPAFTEHVEKELEAVQQGTQQMEDAVDKVKSEFLDLFDKFRQVKPNFLVKMQTLEQTGNVSRGRDNKVIKASQPATSTAMCPKCQQSPMDLIITKNKKQILICKDPNCKLILPLPQKGHARLLKTKCSLCHFNVVKVSSRANNHKIEYYICPVCWNAGLSSHSGEGFCSKCMHYKIETGKCVKK